MNCSCCEAEAVPGRLGFCYKHYKRFKRHGDPLGGRVELGLTEIARIHLRPTEAYDDCLLWTGNVNKYGYGRLKATNQVTVQKMVHRVVYEYTHSVTLAPSQWIDHECHNLAAVLGACKGGVSCLHRRCINAEHLILTDSASNLQASVLTPQGGFVQPTGPDGRFIRRIT